MTVYEPIAFPLDRQARADLAAIAEDTIARGSKSFAAAARLFDPETRRSAMMLYAWCRYCDDTIDGQALGHRRLEADPAPVADGAAPFAAPFAASCAASVPAPSPTPGAAGMAERLARLEAETRAALAGRPSREPSFRAIAEVARRHALPADLVLRHLGGYRMDAAGRRYRTIEDVYDYCYHVAGVVGVLMAMVMGRSEPETLDRACDLGIAFQLTNIARDIVEDARNGRVYLPEDWLREADLAPGDIADRRHRPVVVLLANRLVDAAEPYYASAYHGLAALPPRSAWAVATAHGVYREIGLGVKARGVAAWDERISTGRRQKLAHVARGAAKAALARRGTVAPRPTTLWTRPRDGDDIAR